MKNKKILMYIIIIVLILFILAMGFLVINNHKKDKNNVIEEYTPEQEITDEQLRQTNVTLYFYDIMQSWERMLRGLQYCRRNCDLNGRIGYIPNYCGSSSRMDITL